MTRIYLEINLSDVEDLYEETFTMLLMHTKKHQHNVRIYDILGGEVKSMQLSFLSKLMQTLIQLL